MYVYQREKRACKTLNKCTWSKNHLLLQQWQNTCRNKEEARKKVNQDPERFFFFFAKATKANKNLLVPLTNYFASQLFFHHNFCEDNCSFSLVLSRNMESNLIDPKINETESKQGWKFNLCQRKIQHILSKT